MRERHSRPAMIAVAGAAVVMAGLVPLVVRGEQARLDAATALALFLAALGLWVAVGAGGLPSLGQGAFVGLGAYGAAILQVRHGWSPVAGAVGGAVIAGGAGLVVAAGVVRFRPAFVALATWLAAWMFAIAVDAFPAVTGGAAGMVLPRPAVQLTDLGLRVTAGPPALYEMAVVAVVAGGLALAALDRRYRAATSLVRADSAAARAAGIPVARLRTGALVTSALLGGIAGALLVQLDGVADPTRYGPVLSVKLFIVVVLGGVATAAGPAVGLAALVVVDRVGHALAGAFGRSATRLQPLAAGATLLVVLVAAGRGIVPEATVRWARRRRPRDGRMTTTPAASTTSPMTPEPIDGLSVEGRQLAVAFGGIDALAGVDITVEAGSCHAVIGPNGSGKTTLLRVLAGVVPPDRGHVVLGGNDVTAAGVTARRRAGLARTLQRPAIAAGLTPRQHVVAATEAARRDNWLRSLLSTPRARAAQLEVSDEADRLLAIVGLVGVADRDADILEAIERRLLQVAMALAGGVGVTLLDEPSAGLREPEEARLVAVLESLLRAGLTIVAVEHNVRLVATLADTVTVLDAGRVIAHGRPEEVVREPEVVRAYFGDPDF